MSGTTSYPELWLARRSQIVIAALAVFTAMDINVVSLLLEPIKHDLGLSDVEVGLANASALYVGFGLLSIPMGLLADRLQRVRLLVAAAILWCLGLVLTALSHGLAMLMAGKFILGVANAMTQPAGMSLLTDYFAPKHRGMAMASYGVGQVVGGAAAIMIGGFGLGFLTHISATHPTALFHIAPWRSVSLAFSLCGVAILPFLLTMPEPARQDVRESGTGAIAELWAYRGYLLPLIGVQAFPAGAAVGIMNWIPTALERIYRQAPSDFAGWYSTVSLVSGIGGILLAGHIVPKWIRNGRMILPGIVAAGIFAVTSFMALMPNVVLFALCYVAFSIAYVATSGITILSIGYRMPNELRGAGIAISAVAVSVTSAIGAPLIAWVSDLLGGGAQIGQGMVIIGLAGGILSMVSVIGLPRSKLQPAADSAP